MVVGTIFTANLNAGKIYIDLTYLPDPIKNKFWLTIKNQSLVTLYFKVVCNIANWSMDTPADGKLGSVAGASSTTFTPIITRVNPGAEATDAGSLKIEAYTDSGYTNKIGEDTLDVTGYIEDLEAWTDVAKSDFDDGTVQGWTLATGMSIANDASVEVGGYSARANEFEGAHTQTYFVEKSLGLPNRAKVRVSFFFGVRIRNTSPTFAKSGQVSALSFKVDGVKLFDIPFNVIKETVPTETTRYYGWLKFTADLSAYKNQTKTVRMEWTNESAGTFLFITSWLDRIVVAGED